MIAPGVVVAGRNDHYEVLAEHARGGFGITYRCRARASGAEAILKVLRLDRMESWKAHELFEREAAVLRTLHHPGIPAWIDDFALGDPWAPTGFALVQELIPGRSLREVMRTGGLSRAEMLRWFGELLDVLSYLHERAPPVIHRDVTPKNVILRPDGGAALVDFGSVQAALRAENTVASTAAGTFGYAPLEQFVGRASPQSDLYGLGMTYVAVATGREPAEMPLDGARVDLRAQMEGDPRLCALLEAMTAPDPRQRPASAAWVRAELARLDAADATPAPIAGDHLAARVADVPAYLGLLRDRLRAEGFTVLEGGLLGPLPLAFAATRPRGTRHTSAMRVLVMRAADLGPGGWPTLIGAAAEARGPQGWLRPPATVIPIVIAADGQAGEPPLEARPGVVPVLATLATGEAKVLVDGARLGRGGLEAVAYAWWLATPRLAPRPVGKAPSILRIVTGLAAGLVLLAAAAFAVVVSQPHGTFYLSYAADPRTGHVVVKETYRKRFLTGTSVTTLRAAGAPVAEGVLPADALLCELAGERIGYWRSEPEPGRAGYFRASLAGGAEQPLVQIAAHARVSCALHGDDLAYPVAKGRPGAGVWVHRPGGAQRITGSEPGDQDVAWLPDGTAVIVAHGDRLRERLYRIQLASGTRTLLLPDDGGGQTRPAVAPDGQRVAFYRSVPRTFHARGERDTNVVNDLEVLDLASGKPRLLVQDVCFTTAPVWRGPRELLLGKWLDDRCALYAYDLGSDRVSLVTRRY